MSLPTMFNYIGAFRVFQDLMLVIFSYFSTKLESDNMYGKERK
jgi:hypothetical protein